MSHTLKSWWINLDRDTFISVAQEESKRMQLEKLAFFYPVAMSPVCPAAYKIIEGEKWPTRHKIIDTTDEQD